MVVKEHRAVFIWLLMVAASIFAMALIGAITRLTESGLSIVVWEPVGGAIPPLNEEDWLREFALYQTSPQYQLVNKGMSLEEFKDIYFWEWVHRQWGRMIGVLYALPFFYFLLKNKIPSAYKPHLWGLLVLGGAQGAMGWFMVQSGLVDDPAVSHYRLAAHLSLAFLLFALCLRMALIFYVRATHEAAMLAPLRPLLTVVTVSFCATFVYGAFVAGLDAGLIYNEFPLMGQNIYPAEIFHMSPWMVNFVENHAAVQFIHRILAFVTLTLAFMLWWKSRYFHMQAGMRLIFLALPLAVVAQICLGVATLLTHVDVAIATIHQGGALVILAVIVLLWHHTQCPKIIQSPWMRGKEALGQNDVG